VNRDDGETLFGSGLNTDSQLGFQVKGNPNDPANLDVIIYPTAIKLPRVQGETDEDMRVKSMSAGRAHLVVLTQKVPSAHTVRKAKWASMIEPQIH